MKPLRRCLSFHALLGGMVLALVLLLAASPAAACTFTETGASVGSVSSFRVRSGPAVTSSANFQFACSGVLIALAAGQPSVRATVLTGGSALTLKNGLGDSIPYQVTNGTASPYTAGQVVISVNGVNAVALLNGSLSQVPVSITTTVGPNVAAGTYTDTLQVLWSYRNICEGAISLGNACLGTFSNADTTRSLVLTLTVTNDCAITAPNVQFGSAPLLSAFPTVSQQISLLCTKDLVYTVGISTGGSPSGGRRRMSFGANRLAYDIFKGDGTVWGPTGSARASMPLPADGLNLQAIPYTARIYTDQAQPPAGTYGDTVTVDVGF